MYLNDKAVAASTHTKERDYWINKFSGEWEKAGFYYDFPKNNAGKAQWNSITFIFPGTTFPGLMSLGKGSDHTLHVILLAGLAVLLYRYTGLNDITLGTPIYKQESDVEFINTLLPLRNRLQGQNTFKEILLQVKAALLEAIENQNYPLEILLYNLGLETTADFPLFDIVLLLENIHDKKYIQPIIPNMIFSFLRTPGSIEGTVRYNQQLYKKTTIERIIDHLINMVKGALSQLDGAISGLPLMTETERKKILFTFNNTKRDIPRDKCFHQLYEEQVEKNPHRIAAVYNQQRITYNQLNREANHVAHFLWAQGAESNRAVALYMSRSIKMLAAIIGIFKAGSAYLPIETDYPHLRVQYLLENSNAHILIAGKDMNISESIEKNRNRLPLLAGILYLDHRENFDNGSQKYPVHNPGQRSDPGHLAYMIYTSGTTGNPKGVLIHHLGMLNHLYGKIGSLTITGEDVIAQTASACFDISIWQFLAGLLVGGAAYIIDKEVVFDAGRFLDILQKSRVSILELVPSLMTVFLEIAAHERDHKLDHLRWMISTGEALSPQVVEKWYRLYPGIKLVNAYGPTEASDDVTHHVVERFPPGTYTTIPIGKPLPNLHIYILDQHLNLCPVGVRGEICVAGLGVGMGYWQDEEKTNRAFIANPFLEEIGDMDYSRLYRTGDTGYFQPDGTIVCLGRTDHQVKIRGNRIELGEIERQLLNHKQIKEAVVVDREIENSGTYLCAYIVSAEAAGAPAPGKIPPLPGSADLNDYLSHLLPEYMIPSYFIHLDHIPLTTNGKVDRKALPAPELERGETYAPPGDAAEKQLTEIWSEVLGIEKEQISIDANFFQLGGHSLSATLAAARIHKTFDVKLPLVELFRQPTIRGLAKAINGLAREKYLAISPLEKKEYYVLSPAQQRVYTLHYINPGNIGYNMPYAVTVEGSIEKERFEHAFKRLIARHESLKTSFEMVNNDVVQKIHDEVNFKVEYYDLAGGEDEEKIVSDFVRPFDLSRAPLLRVGMIHTPSPDAPARHQGESSNSRYILLTDMHHIIADGASQEVLTRDFNALYAGTQLPALKLHYKDCAQWQQDEKNKKTMQQQEKYWLEQFKDGGSPLQLPLDYPRSEVQSFEGDRLFFSIAPAEANALKEITLKHNTTMFMALLCLYNILLSKICSQEDIVVGIPIAGRRHADLEKIIGMFVNTLALRNHPQKEKTFATFLNEVKENTLAAFENQDYHFEDLVDRVAADRDKSRNPLYDVMFDVIIAGRAEDAQPGDKDGLVRITPYNYNYKTTNVDLALVCLEDGKRLVFEFIYCTKLFKPGTIQRFSGYFKDIIMSVLEDEQLKLKDIAVTSNLVPSESTISRQDLEDFGY